MATQMINWSNVSNFNDVLVAANTQSSGAFWTSILYMVVFVAFLAMIPFGFETAAIASLFLGIMLGVFMLYLGLTSMLWVGVLVGFEIFIFIYIGWASGRNQ